MANKPPTTDVVPTQPEEPDGWPAFDTESFWQWLAKSAAKVGNELVEKALLAFFVFVDPRTPNGARTILLAALAYLVLPADAIPDFLPVAGFMDDMAALGAAFSAIADNVRVRHLRHAREQMRVWGIAVEIVSSEWDNDARLSEVDQGDPEARAA